MRGVAYREFLAFLAHATSAGFVEDALIETRIGADPPFRDHAECIAKIIALMRHASTKTGYEFDDMARDFGRWMFAAFIREQPELFIEARDLPDLLTTVTDVFNNLHDDAPGAPPSLRLTQSDGAALEAVYRSAHGLASLSAGLIGAALAHYGAASAFERADAEPNGVHSVFTIRIQR